MSRRSSGELGGSPPSPWLVLTAAYRRPSASASMFLRLMWSSARSGPERGVSSGAHWLSGAPSWCAANRNAADTWFDHITPICPLKAITAEMSSELTAVSGTGGEKGAVQLVSAVVECMTQTLLA